MIDDSLESTGQYPPVEQETTVPLMMGELFHSPPGQWGLRGDPLLWAEMARQLAAVPCADSPTSQITSLARYFAELTGESITRTSSIFVERYHQGGLSSGLVSPEFWRDILIPQLVSRAAGRGA